MQEQMNRMEEKIDKLLETRHEHHGRITKLESQAGFVKGIAALAVTIFAAVFSYFAKQMKG